MIETPTFNNEEASLCNRCKAKETEMICNDCSPYSNFCSACDNYIHSLPSKRTHKRYDISPNKSQLQPQLQPLPHPHEDSAKYQMMYSSANISQANTRVPFGLSQESLDNQYQAGTSVSQNYINEIRKIYEAEKEELINKSYLIEKKLNNTTASMNERIQSLTRQLEEQSAKKDIDLHQINETHQMELQRIIAEKDNQIQYLYAKNFEVEKANDELVYKLNQYADLMNENKIGYSEQLANASNRVHNLERDLAEMKDFYESKLGYFTKNFSAEKNKIIESYEVTIEKLTAGYNDSKGKYVSVINQREEEIRGVIMSHRNEVDNFNATIEQQKQSIASLQCDQNRLIQMNSEQKSEIEIQKRTIDNLKKENQFSLQEKKKVAKESEIIQKNLEQLKMQNDKMHRLTHGKLKK